MPFRCRAVPVPCRVTAAVQRWHADLRRSSSPVSGLCFPPSRAIAHRFPAGAGDEAGTEEAQFGVQGEGGAGSDQGRHVRGTQIRPPLRDRKFADSLLEGDGFEPSVPVAKKSVFVAEGELREWEGGQPTERCFFYGVPMVRIHLPPAASQVRTPVGSGPFRKSFGYATPAAARISVARR
jgi:hypothetical protein